MSALTVLESAFGAGHQHVLWLLEVRPLRCGRSFPYSKCPSCGQHLPPCHVLCDSRTHWVWAQCPRCHQAFAWPRQGAVTIAALEEALGHAE